VNHFLGIFTELNRQHGCFSVNRTPEKNRFKTEFSFSLISSLSRDFMQF
jgi:hypothetical protein